MERARSKNCRLSKFFQMKPSSPLKGAARADSAGTPGTTAGSDLLFPADLQVGCCLPTLLRKPCSHLCVARPFAPTLLPSRSPTKKTDCSKQRMAGEPPDLRTSMASRKIRSVSALQLRACHRRPSASSASQVFRLPGLIGQREHRVREPASERLVVAELLEKLGVVAQHAAEALRT